MHKALSSRREQKFLDFTDCLVSAADRTPRPNSSEVELKRDHSPVTTADQFNAIRFIAMLQHEDFFPSLRVISEEDQFHRIPAWHAYASVDPLDGTSAFLADEPIWAVSVAIIFRKTVIAGVVAQPALKRAFRAIRGDGVMAYDYESERWSPLIRAAFPNELVIGTDFGHRTPVAYTTEVDRVCRRLEALGYNTPTKRQNMPAVHGAIETMLGNVSFYWSRTFHHWDVAATMLQLQEVSGVAKQTDGGDVCFDGGTRMAPMFFARSSADAETFLQLVKE